MALLPRSKESSISNTSSNDNSSENDNNNKLATTRWYSRKGLTVVGMCLALAMSISQMEREGKGNKDRITQVVASLQREYPVPVTGVTNGSNWTKQEEQQQPTTKSSRTSSQFPPGFLPNQTLYNLQHYANQEILGLLDWEETSRIGILNDTANSCQPPPGTPRTCCLGCFSRGGGMDPNVRHQCAHAFHDNNNQWEMLQEQVHKFFANNKPPHLYDNDNDGGMPCDICQIVELSRLHSLRIAMIGDSMHAQVAAGLHCELQRRGYHVYRTTEKVPKKNQGNHNHDFLEHFYYNVTSPTWDSSSGTATTVQISYHMLYQFPLFNNHSRTKMAEILSTSQVLILGMGLHWKYGNIKHGRTRWAKDMGRVFQQALRAKKSAVELLVERETTAQHFDVPGGDYHEWRTALSQQQQQQEQQQPGEQRPACTNRLGAATYWRERLLDRNETQQQYGYQRIMAGPNMSLLHNNNNSVVVALPYHNFTQLFDKMHPTGGADCTHYCSSPFMYMTLWRSLRLAMDHRYKKSRSN